MLLSKLIYKNYLLYLISIFLLYYVVNESFFNFGGEDFRIFIGVSKLMLLQQPLYNQSIDLGKGISQLYSYPPFLAFTLIPFVNLISEKSMVAIWQFLNLFLVFRIVIFSTFLFDFLEEKKLKWIVNLTLLIVLRFLMHNFDLAQMNIFILYLCLESYYQYQEKNNKILASILIAIGISIKLIPIVVLYYYLIKKDNKFVFQVIIWVLIILLLPFIFFPFDYLSSLYEICWSKINPFQTKFNSEIAIYSQGLSSVSVLLFKLLNIETVFNIVLFINTMRGVLLLYIYKIWKSSRENSKMNQYILFSICCISMSLFMPHQSHYSFVSIFPLILYILYKFSGFNLGYLNKFLFLMSLIFLIVSSELFVGKQFKYVCLEYQSLSFGSILLIILTSRITSRIYPSSNHILSSLSGSKL